MTNEQKQVKEWMIAFGQDAPDKPIIPSLEIRKLRAKLILEEALETIVYGLGIYWLKQGRDYNFDLADILAVLNHNEAKFEDQEEIKPNLELIADGCSDLKVVTYGTLVACGLIKQEPKIPYEPLDKHYDPLFDEIMRSNWSKFWTTEEVNTPDSYPQDYEIIQMIPAHPMDVKKRIYLVKDKNGKVIKSPSYSPPKLKEIIEQL